MTRNLPFWTGKSHFAVLCSVFNSKLGAFWKYDFEFLDIALEYPDFENHF